MDLTNLSTFRIAGLSASEIVAIDTVDDIHRLIQSEIFKKSPSRLIVGGGSNIVFTQDFDGLIIHNNLKGRTIINNYKVSHPERSDSKVEGSPQQQFKNRNLQSVIISLGSGENRHDTVMRSVGQGYTGLENLVAIPGSVGASPVQNIGAYGAEVRDVILEVRGINLLTGESKVYTNEQCEFGYRDSIFKHTLGQDFFITEVIIQLTTVNPDIYNPKIHYAGIQEQLLINGRDGGDLSPLDIANAISTIRASKLPDWTQIGTCGSFFANPIISTTHYEDLKKDFPDLIGHPTGTHTQRSSLRALKEVLLEEGIKQSSQSKEPTIKLSAGQLIELCGLKGYRDGDAGVYDRHALVLVNYGNATGSQIQDLISLIQSHVKEKFGIEIAPEVNVM